MSRNDRRQTGGSPFSADFSQTTTEEPFFVEIDEDPQPVAPSPEVEPPPAWFRGPASQDQPPQAAKPSPPPPPRPGKSSKPHQQNPRRRAPIVADEEESDELSWREKAKRWIFGEGGAGYGVSVVLHVVLLLILSLLIYSNPKEEPLITTLEQTEVVDMASIQDVEIEELETDFEPQVNNPLFEPAPLSAPDIGVGSPASSLTDSIGGGLKIEIPRQAVTKGSFTVWTEPEDPQPGEKYDIWIQVKLSNEVKRYPKRDLSGNIVGTDGYKDYFGGATEPGYLPIADNAVRYKALTVPGAAQLVKDIINVESKILKEKQTIELVF